MKLSDCLRARGYRASAAFLLLFLAAPRSETVGIFYDSAQAQAAFAANDIKAALADKGLSADMAGLAGLSAAYPGKKIILATAGNAAVSALLSAQGGAAATGPGEQAYALRTTSKPEVSYWDLGGDANGVMYGGLQLAENIRAHGFSGTYNSEEGPYLKRRGIKFNIPLDSRCPTYYGAGASTNTFNGTVFQEAVPHMWDLAFWKSWFDEMARHRYNVLSLWNLHPFSAMISMPEYPNAALQDVKGFNGFSKTMGIDQKIAFWKQVMAYGRNRGFEIYLIDWNIYTDGATGNYGINNDPANAATVTYIRKAMTRLLETYPDLTGFGVTSGENMGNLTPDGEEKWMWSTIGQGIYDFAKVHPERKVTFVHRYHQTGGPAVVSNFKPLFDLPNVRIDMSYKYSKAHMYSTPNPAWMTDDGIPADLAKAGLKTWLEVRNEDFFMLHWGDPAFVKAYLTAFPDKDKNIQGFFYGSDGWVNARVFASKDALYKGDLEIRRTWYTQMLWGRLAYNPSTPDEVFTGAMGVRYPGISPVTLFNAWSKASQGVPMFTEMVQGTWSLDFHWWPEACLSTSGFRTIDDMPATVPAKGSKMCSVAKSAAKTCGTARTAYQVADDIQAASQGAIDLIGDTGGGANAELRLNINNIRALSYLGLYYAQKLRGATYKAEGQTVPARDAMAKAECAWRSYAALMSSMYTGMKMHRVDDIADWHAMDASVLGELSKLGGAPLASCQVASEIPSAVSVTGPGPGVTGLGRDAISIYLPAAGAYRVEILSLRGERNADLSGTATGKGRLRIGLHGALEQGVYLVRLTAGGRSLVRRMQTLQD